MREPRQLSSLRTAVVAGALLALAAGALPAQPPAEAPGSVTVCEQARRLAADGQAKRAIDLLDRAAAAGHRTPELYNLRGQLRQSLGDVEAAERDWQRAAELDQADWRSRLQLARLYAQRGLWSDAIACYRAILLTEPRHADAVLGLAEAYEKLGRKVGAANLLQAASDAIDDRRIHERWARMARALGRPEDAESALRRVAASAAGPARRDALLALAELYLAQERPQEALDAAREALSLEEPSGEIGEATYDAIALATDYEVGQVGAELRETLNALDGKTLEREEAFAATQALRFRLADAERVLKDVGVPAARRNVHARRLFAYALAAEAALNALESIDLGLADRREAFAARLAEADVEIGQLATATPGGK